MSILDRVKKILPKRREPELKNNIPKEKENIRKTFSAYCNANHSTKDGKLCAKCTATLTSALLKINRCPYGIGKPICDRCETPCFGEKTTNEFLEIMKSGQKKMMLSHPIMAVKHKLAGLGVDYAKMQRDKNSTEKQKEQEEKIKERLAGAMKSPKSAKPKKKRKKK